MFEKKKINENLIDLKKNLENQKNWDDFEKTNKNLKKLNYLSNFLKSIDEIQKSYEDTIELIKITDEKAIKKYNPDYMLVLPWHFKNFILQKEKKYLNNGGKMIFPLPDIEIV